MQISEAELLEGLRNSGSLAKFEHCRGLVYHKIVGGTAEGHARILSVWREPEGGYLRAMLHLLFTRNGIYIRPVTYDSTDILATAILNKVL